MIIIFQIQTVVPDSLDIKCSKAKLEALFCKKNQVFFKAFVTYNYFP